MLPINSTPYFIYAPAYTHISSGVRALHLLCHFLNEAGEKAYLVPDKIEGYAINPYLNTPLVEMQHVNYCNTCGVEPIFVYPDIVIGNPHGSKKVVRWLLAHAGKYGGDKTFPETNKIWGYTTLIAHDAKTENVLFLPTYDTNIFYLPEKDIAREGACFYSHKYDKIHGNTLLPISGGAIRLEGAPEQLAEILRRSKICFVYELSEIITNAELCGCEVILVRTSYFKDLADSLDFEHAGARWSDEPDKVCKSNAWWELEHAWARFRKQLTYFITETQSWSANG